VLFGLALTYLEDVLKGYGPVSQLYSPQRVSIGHHGLYLWPSRNGDVWRDGGVYLHRGLGEVV